MSRPGRVPALQQQTYVLTAREVAQKLKRPIERLAYRRDEAAAVLGVSLTKFEEWVARGMMPKPVKVDGCTLYDAHQLAVAWHAIMAGETASFDSRSEYDDD